MRGRRRFGGPRLRWRDYIKGGMRNLELPEDEAEDRGAWRGKTLAADLGVVCE